jgi:hypothetical protein
MQLFKLYGFPNSGRGQERRGREEERGRGKGKERGGGEEVIG